MTLEKHDLLHEFPESKESIHTLKMNNNHFARLFEQYHDKDHEVHRIETGAENTSDDYLEVRKKERLKLKDELFAMIRDYEQQQA
ncbi:MAG: DUF465 domain-containing protein [Pseudomonadales bacterium]|nr:DUF465 domain-containing protein [Pseudomonadales bacterium]